MNRHFWTNRVGKFVTTVLRSADCPRHRQYRHKKPGSLGQTLVVMNGPTAIMIGHELGGIKHHTLTMIIGIIDPLDPLRAVTLRNPPIRPVTEHILHDAINAIMQMTNGGAIIILAPHPRLLGTHIDSTTIVTIVDIARTGRNIP